MIDTQTIIPVSARPATPCEPEHAALKASGDLWAALPFGGIHPLGPRLLESRQCLLCDSTLVRPVSLARALMLLVEALTSTSPPEHKTVRSAFLVADWAAENLPSALGAQPVLETMDGVERDCVL
jgi:hypothetical protein